MAIGENAQGTIKPGRKALATRSRIGPEWRRGSITVNQGLTPGAEFATIVIYRIDNSLMLIGRVPAQRQSPRARGCHADTGNVRTASSKTCSGPNPEAAWRCVRCGRVRARGRLHVELSLHHDLASIESDWRAFEEQRRLHRVPDLRLAVDVAPKHRRARGVQARRRDRPARGRDPVPAAVRARNRTASSARSPGSGRILCNYNGPLLARDFSRRVSPAQFVRGLARSPAAAAAAAGSRPDRSGENAEGHRRAGQSVLRARRHAARQRRLSDDARRRLGNLLRGEALVVDAQDRPQETQAPCRSRRDSVRHRRPIATTWCGRVDALIDEKRQILRQARRRQHVRAARISRLLSRPGDRLAKLAPDASQPARCRRR